MMGGFVWGVLLEKENGLVLYVWDKMRLSLYNSIKLGSTFGMWK
jgi:hypothetical protein